MRARDIERLQDEGVQHAEDDSVGADGQREGENGGDGESGRAAELAHGEPRVGSDGLEGGPLPHFAAALFDHGEVAKGDARLAFGFLRAQAFARELFHALFKMQAHLLGEIVEEGAAAEDARYPVHGSLLASWRRICPG